MRSIPWSLQMLSTVLVATLPSFVKPLCRASGTGPEASGSRPRTAARPCTRTPVRRRRRGPLDVGARRSGIARTCVERVGLRFKRVDRRAGPQLEDTLRVAALVRAAVEHHGALRREPDSYWVGFVADGAAVVHADQREHVHLAVERLKASAARDEGTPGRARVTRRPRRGFCGAVIPWPRSRWSVRCRWMFG
jgi:hypothetical protein